MMSTKTRGSSIGTVTTVIVALLIAGTVFKVWPPKPRVPGSKENPIVQFSAIWTPSPRPKGVFILVTVGGVVMHEGMDTVAPFMRTFEAKRGQYLEIRSTLGPGGESFLGCSITVNGLEVVNDHYDKAKPDSRLTCQATA